MYRPIPTYRGFVYPWHTDHVGHMNVQFYTARFDEATWQFLVALGLTPALLREQGRSAVAADQHTRYRREVVAGTPLHVTTELLAVGRTSLRFVHRMYDSATDEEVASTELVGVYFDLASRRSAPLPDVVHARASALLTGTTDAAPYDLPTTDVTRAGVAVRGAHAARAGRAAAPRRGAAQQGDRRGPRARRGH